MTQLELLKEFVEISATNPAEILSNDKVKSYLKKIGLVPDESALGTGSFKSTALALRPAKKIPVEKLHAKAVQLEKFLKANDYRFIGVVDASFTMNGQTVSALLVHYNLTPKTTAYYWIKANI